LRQKLLFQLTHLSSIFSSINTSLHRIFLDICWIDLNVSTVKLSHTNISHFHCKFFLFTSTETFSGSKNILLHERFWFKLVFLAYFIWISFFPVNIPLSSSSGISTEGYVHLLVNVPILLIMQRIIGTFRFMSSSENYEYIASLHATWKLECKNMSEE